MPHNPSTDFLVQEEVIEDEFSADDFSFIIGPDGSLKSMLIPGHLMDDPPVEVQMILDIFGIKDINQLGDITLH